MEHVAIISDLHGNLPALEAVLCDIKRRNISRSFCLGDLVGKGPHSEKVVDICQDVCEVTIKGNWDDFIVRDTENPTLRWHQQRLGSERLDYLRQLPQTIEPLRTEALLMPAERRVLGVSDDKIIPVPLDRDLAHVLADIDDFLRMGTFADQVT